MKGVWFIKYWGGGGFTKSGVPDILCCVCGRFLAIEVKASNGHPTELQCSTLSKIDEAGGMAILLYPDHETLFKNMIDCIVAGDIYNAQYNYSIFKKRTEKEWESLKNRYTT